MKIYSSIGTNPVDIRQNLREWSLTAIVPVEIFVHHQGLELSGLRDRANFYKCGDETETPHYLSWNPIDSARPYFLHPYYFVIMLFDYIILTICLFILSYYFIYIQSLV